MKKFILLLALIGAAVGGWYALSPWMAMAGLRDAAMEADHEELAQRINFSAVRTSIKEQVRDLVAEKVGKGDNGNVLEQFGRNLAVNMAGRAVDAAVTPEGMAGIIVTGALASPLISAETMQQEIEWSVERDGFSRFRGVGVLESGRSAPTLIFERDGISWKLVDVELPEGMF